MEQWKTKNFKTKRSIKRTRKSHNPLDTTRCQYIPTIPGGSRQTIEGRGSAAYLLQPINHPFQTYASVSRTVNEGTQLLFLKSIPSFIPKLPWVREGFFLRVAGRCFGAWHRPTDEKFLAPKVDQTAHKLHPSAPPKPEWLKPGSAPELRLTGNFIFSAR